MKTPVSLGLLAVLVLAACSPLQGAGTAPSQAAPANSPTVTQPVATRPLPSETIIQDTPTASGPGEGDQAASEASEAGTQEAAGSSVNPQTVQIFLIAMDDNGGSGAKVGCGDSVVPVQVQIPPTRGVLKAALEALLANKDQFYGQSGLYNSLYQSDIKLESVAIKEGKATIQLSGALKLGGECDNPRVEAQILQTALQFSTVSEVEVFLNGKPLKEALSLK